MRRGRLLPFMWFILFMWAFAAQADDGRNEVMEGVSTSELERLASQGKPEAENALAIRYRDGFGPQCVTTSTLQGKQLSRRCEGSEDETTPKDIKRAVALFRKAASRGFADAQFNLGNMYFVYLQPRDEKQALYWFRMAAEKGHAYALTNLGSMYKSGNGVARDLVIAYALETLAQARAPTMYTNPERTAKEMSPQQIDEGKRLASQWRVGTPLPRTSTTGKEAAK